MVSKPIDHDTPDSMLSNSSMSVPPNLNTNRAQDKPTTVIFCKSNRTFASQRERWWYIALSNCDSKKGLRLKYRIVMTNDQAHGSWIKHFSADQLCKLHFRRLFFQKKCLHVSSCYCHLPFESGSQSTETTYLITVSRFSFRCYSSSERETSGNEVLLFHCSTCLQEPPLDLEIPV